MKYKTTNDLTHYNFENAHIANLSQSLSSFEAILDGVTILASHPHNRDIRNMLANDLHFTLNNAKITLFVEEGYKVYDADGNLTGTNSDRILTPDQYGDALKGLTDSSIYEISKTGSVYTFDIDDLYNTWKIQVEADGDFIEWDRFVAPDGMN